MQPRKPFMGDGVVAPRPDDTFASFVGSEPGSLRVGFTTESREAIDTHQALVDAVHSVAQLLESFGHAVSADQAPAALRNGDSSMGPLLMVGTAARLEAIAELLGRELTADDVEPGTWQMAAMAEGITGTQIAHAQGAQMRFRHQMASWWGTRLGLVDDAHDRATTAAHRRAHSSRR